MTPLQEAILASLKETGYNVTATANRLGVSVTYAQRVADQFPIGPMDPQSPPPIVAKSGSSPQSDRAVLAAPQVLPGALIEAISAVLPPNVEGIVDLRDNVIDQLKEHLSNGDMPISALRGLLKDILEYEAKTRAIARPAANLTIDARQQTINMTNLVDILSGLHEDELRLLSEGEIIDA